MSRRQRSQGPDTNSKEASTSFSGRYTEESFSKIRHNRSGSILCPGRGGTPTFDSPASLATDYLRRRSATIAFSQKGSPSKTSGELL